METIVKFFLSKNIRIARSRAWDQTVKSRGKGADFWQPYYEEWQQPPVIPTDSWKWKKWVGNFTIGVLLQRVAIMALRFYPLVGIAVTAWIKGIQTARHLHEPYFTAKHMTEHESAIFMEERKWDYRAFGFTAALVEHIPFVGLLFTVSNRVGAAMWAHDLEKRQHMFRSGVLKPLPPREVDIPFGASIQTRPAGTGLASDQKVMSGTGQEKAQDMAGTWREVTSEDSRH